MLHGVRIIEICDVFHGSGQFRTGAGIHFDGFLHQIHIEPDTTVVDFLIDVVFIPDRIRHRELGEALLYRHFDFHIPPVICLKERPLLRIVKGQVPGATAICFCGSAGHRKIFDERLALIQLLFFEL